MTDDFGSPLRWDDRYLMTYVTLNGGGKHTSDITRQLQAKQNKPYVASGKVKYILYKDAFTQPRYSINKFQNVVDCFVNAALKLELATYLKANQPKGYKGFKAMQPYFTSP